MKQVDLSSLQGPTGQFGELQASLQQVVRGSRTKAQDTLVRLFSSGLNNHFVLVRNLVVPDENPKALGYLIPCILIGPACLLVINPSDLHGFFRAQEDTWLEMAKNSTDYRPAARNLIQETLRASGKVERKYSETLRRAERFQGGKGSQV